MPWWFRAFLLVNVVQDLAVGITGLRGPEHILVPLEGLTPLNSRFIAALYLAGGLAILVAALLPDVTATRPVMAAFGVITLLVAAVTYANWDEFTAGGTPTMWLVTYTLDPIVIAALVVVFALWRLGPTLRHRLTALLLIEAAVFGVLGLALLVVPGAMVEFWPWAMTTLLARVYAAFFLAFAVGPLIAAFDPRVATQVPVFTGSFALTIFTLVASALHSSRFDGGPATWLWLGTAVAGAAAFGAGLVYLATRPRGEVIARSKFA
jgi:hypothetical protein